MFITREDYREWLENQVTKWVFSQIEEVKAATKEKVVYGSGVYHPGDAAKTTALMGQMIGFIQGLDELKKLKPKGK